MISLEKLGGSARPCILYGVGVGPGDAGYITLRAAGLITSVAVIAYFARRGAQGHARRIADPLIQPGREEIRLEYPITEEVSPADPAYTAQISRFYNDAADRLARTGQQLLFAIDAEFGNGS